MSDIDLTTVPPYPVYRLEVDAEGAVTLDGVPIATGEGAKAALSAFDHLIRSDDEEVVEESAEKHAMTA